jgi:hypothetical protein
MLGMPASLGVVLVHPAFIGLFGRAGLTPSTPDVWGGLPLTCLAVFAASLLTTTVVRQIPYLRRVVG